MSSNISTHTGDGDGQSHIHDRNSNNDSTAHSTQHSTSDPYALPPPAELRAIARKQDVRAQALREENDTSANDAPHESASEHSPQDAAEAIQRAFRGHRVRREGDDAAHADERWTQIVKDAKYNEIAKPVSRADTGNLSVRERWRRIQTIANRVGGPSNENDTSTDQDEPHRPASSSSNQTHFAQTMGLKYFLELVDPQHRYGSSLRHYHREWEQSDTKENFFYWLDEGEGRNLDLPERPRHRLDTERVRYLSRDERKLYRVRVNEQGRLYWAKTGKLVDTSNAWKDSVAGIVPADDPTPSWRTTQEQQHTQQKEEANQDAAPADSAAISTAQPSLRPSSPTRGKNSPPWIFVADASSPSRLYIGIKSSGAFQHSSFLAGGRVLAAGQLRTRDGQLRSLTPLSGHYAPPVSSFRAFVQSLKFAGADLSRVSLIRSYAMLLGVEGWGAAKGLVGKGKKRKEMRKREREEKEEKKKKKKEMVNRKGIEKGKVEESVAEAGRKEQQGNGN